MKEGEYLDSLVGEYANLLRERLSKQTQIRHDDVGIISELTTSADWTVQGARELLRLVHNQGAFMLRNALAIAIVLGKEDGALGF
jgi:hypothetical protein